MRSVVKVLAAVAVLVLATNNAFAEDIFTKGASFALSMDVYGFEATIVRQSQTSDLPKETSDLPKETSDLQQYLLAGRGSRFIVFKSDDKVVCVQFTNISNPSAAALKNVGKVVTISVTNFKGFIAASLTKDNIGAEEFIIQREYIPERYVHPAGWRWTIGVLAVPFKVDFYPQLSMEPGGAVGPYAGCLFYLGNTITIAPIASLGYASSELPNAYGAAGCILGLGLAQVGVVVGVDFPSPVRSWFSLSTGFPFIK